MSWDQTMSSLLVILSGSAILNSIGYLTHPAGLTSLADIGSIHVRGTCFWSHYVATDAIAFHITQNLVILSIRGRCGIPILSKIDLRSSMVPIISRLAGEGIHHMAMGI